MSNHSPPRPRAVHDLKCHSVPFQALSDGAKTHEFRRDDRGFAVGDELYLREWKRPAGMISIARYTGRELRMIVTYISRGPEFGIPDGFCVMSVRST